MKLVYGKSAPFSQNNRTLLLYITFTANYTPNIFLFIRLFGVKRTQVKPEVNADAPNGWTVPAPHFAPVA